MKKLWFAWFLMSSAIAGPDGFVNPLTYDNSEEQKQKVIKYIQKESLHKYCDNELACHPNVLALAQSDNFMAFLTLSNIENKDYLNSLIEEYCLLGNFQCSYVDLLKIYEESLWCDVKLSKMRSVENSDYKNRKYPNPIQEETRAYLIH